MVWTVSDRARVGQPLTSVLHLPGAYLPSGTSIAPVASQDSILFSQIVQLDPYERNFNLLDSGRLYSSRFLLSLAKRKKPFILESEAQSILAVLQM